MPLLAGLGPLGPVELGLILLIIVLIFGVGRLPEVGGAIGKGIREFRKATKDDETRGATTDASSAGASDAPSAATDSAEGAVFCSECGTRNTRAAKFCSSCGNSLGTRVG